jgi:hypothetical protein
MGWVSKSEDDQEALDFERHLGGFTALAINPKAAERDRLKRENYNLSQYKQIVEFLLKSARKQIKKLEDEICNLQKALAQSHSMKLSERQVGEKHLLELRRESDSRLRALETKLNEYQFKEFAQLYQMSDAPAPEKKFGDEPKKKALTKTKTSFALNPVIPPGTFSRPR